MSFPISSQRSRRRHMNGLRLPRLFRLLLIAGMLMLLAGAGMRVYAEVSMAQTEQRLILAHPASPRDIETRTSSFVPADGPTTMIKLPALGLWNALEPVDEQFEWVGGQMTSAWDVGDAGWHIQSSWPGWGGNAVIAGHSPSREPQTWPRSVFRQLAYLLPGDQIEVPAGSRTYLYQESTGFVVSGTDAQSSAATAWIAPFKAERLTLITCWPPHTAAYRVVVIAQPINSTMKEQNH